MNESSATPLNNSYSNVSEAEKAVLGAIIERGELYDELDLATDDFSYANHRILYDAMQTTKQLGVELDLTTLVETLSQGNLFEEIGGFDTIVACTEACTSLNHAEHYAKLVKESSRERKAKRAAAEYLNGETTIEDLQTNLELLGQTTQKHQGTDAYGLSLLFLQLLNKKEDDLIYTGIKPLDDVLDGVKPTDLVVVGARPSVGKTAFGMNLGHNLSEQDVGVSNFSYEVGDEEIMRRLVALGTGVPLRKLKKAHERLDLNQIQRGVNYMNDLSKRPIINHAASGLTIHDIKREVKRDKKRFGDKRHVVLIDHLHIIPASDPRMTEVMSLTEISRVCKEMAVELRTPVILLAQLNRALEQRQDKRPQKSDLRGSGSIEQDADTILFLHREDYYDADTEDQNIMEVIVSKQRDGELGKVQLYFNKETGKLLPFEREVPHGL